LGAEFETDYLDRCDRFTMLIYDFPALIKDCGIDISRYSNTQKIELIEWFMLREFDNIADDLPVDHHIHDGMYERELFIPAGVMLTGKVHKQAHLCFLLQGELSVMTDDGMQRLNAPAKFRVKANSKKIGYAHTDVRFTTVHRTDLIDFETIENELFEDSNLAWINNIIINKRIAA
jgi:hypothetical protein